MKEKNELKRSAVVFDEATHTYTADGRNPQGITPIVNWVFSQTYDGIPADVLKKAADHGTAVHHACQMLDAVGIVDDECKREAEAYKELKERAGLKTLLNEYTVDIFDDDCAWDFASQIDVVFEEDETGCYPIADIKTTSQIHLENVSLQLSIYAYIFECQNLKNVGRLYCIWLPKEQYGQPSIVEVPRVPADVIEYVLDHYVWQEDAERCAELVREKIGALQKTAETWLPANIRQVELEIAAIEREQKRMKSRSEELRSGLLKLMQENGVKKWEGEHIILTRKEGSVRKSLDSSKVKADYPDVYYECLKESEVAESLTIRLK